MRPKALFILNGKTTYGPFFPSFLCTEFFTRFPRGWTSFRPSRKLEPTFRKNSNLHKFSDGCPMPVQLRELGSKCSGTQGRKNEVDWSAQIPCVLFMEVFERVFSPDWKRVWTGVQRCAGMTSMPG